MEYLDSINISESQSTFCVSLDKEKSIYDSQESVGDRNKEKLADFKAEFKEALETFNRKYNPTILQKAGERVKESVSAGKEKAAKDLKNVANKIKETFITSGKSLGDMKEVLIALKDRDVGGAKEKLGSFKESFKNLNPAAKAITGGVLAVVIPCLASIGFALAAPLIALAVGIKDALQQIAHFVGKKGAQTLVNKLETKVAEMQKSGLEKDQMKNNKEINDLNGKIENGIKLLNSYYFKKTKAFLEEFNNVPTEGNKEQIQELRNKIPKISDGNLTLEKELNKLLDQKTELSNLEQNIEKFAGKIEGKVKEINNLKERGGEIKGKERPETMAEKIVSGLKGVVAGSGEKTHLSQGQDRGQGKSP